jgi:hypothetical protein
MRIVTAVLGALTAIAIFAGWNALRTVEAPNEEHVKTPTLITVRLAGTESAMGIDYDWKRRGPDALANFSIENANEFDVTSYEVVCYLFDKDAKRLGEVRYPISSKLGAGSKTAISGVLFRNVEPLSRAAICQIDNALPSKRR